MAVWKVVENQNGVRASVWISSLPGAEPREYSPAPFAVKGSFLPEFLSFSPNGESLYLSRYSEDGAREAWLLPFPPGNDQPRRLFRNASRMVPWEASWMPDSRHMVLESNRGLSLLDTRTESLRRLDDGSAFPRFRVVSPDGKRLLVSRETQSAGIFELPLDGSAPRKLLATSQLVFGPSWSRRGNEFAFLRGRDKVSGLWYIVRKVIGTVL